MKRGRGGEERPLAAMRAPCLPALVPAISGGAWVKNSGTQTILFFLPKAVEVHTGEGDKRQDGPVAAIRNSGQLFFLRNAPFVSVLYTRHTKIWGLLEFDHSRRVVKS